jgi:LPPG:FO 2-phospho-L-lactate transferase
MLRALSSAVEPSEITAIVNTGDDTVLHGLHISPDLDTVTYTLAGAINAETGWGLGGETWKAMGELAALSAGRLSWFNLGDHDLGTHLYRTARLAEGASLSDVTAEIAARWGLAVRLLPMTDDRVETRVRAVVDGAEIELGFQEYFVGHHHDLEVRGITLRGIEVATPAPGAVEAIEAAERIVICPSNPLVSIGPVLATPGIGAAVAARRHDVVAVSPIVGGRALKGPADRMLSDLGHTSSVGGVARLWAPYAATLIIDPADADARDEVEAAGLRAVVAPSVMSTPEIAHALALTALAPYPRPVIAGRADLDARPGGQAR